MLSVEREPVVAGTFYSSNPKELISQLKDCFSGYELSVKTNVSALIVPHAGYLYSGKVAASAYSLINTEVKYDNIFVIGSSHHVSFNGASVYNKGHYKTPLGVVPVNLEVANELIKNGKNMVFNDSAHSEEHTIEVQLPFLQYCLRHLHHIVPVVIGIQKEELCQEIAESLKPYFNENNLFIFSTDFSHYPSDDDARTIDAKTVDAICSNDPELLKLTLKENENKKIPNLYTSLCGWSSVLTLMYLTQGSCGFKYSKIKYMTSGDIFHKRKVVGYQSILVESVLSKVPNLLHKDKIALLKYAHDVIKNHFVFNKESIVKPVFDEELNDFGGAFVSVYVDNKLRGCIGQFNSEMDLYQLVKEMAVSAAYQDSRFAPVSEEELDKLHVEISVLTPMRKINHIDEIELGRHGVYLKKDEFTGTFLPQVATKTKWELEEFLGHLAKDKAHIGWEGWRDAEIYIYEAIVFSE